jgi:hypothetical protein
VNRIRIAVAFAVTAGVTAVAAFASGARSPETRPALIADEPWQSNVQIVAIATAIISTGPVASGVQTERLGGIVVIEETEGWLSTTDEGVQTDLDPDDELFDIVRVEDLPVHLRSQAGTHGFSAPMYEGVDGNVDGVVLFATNFTALLAMEGVAYQQRGTEVPELSLGPPPETEPVTTNVQVMVMRFPSEEAADRIFGEYGEQEGELRVALRGIDEGSDFDFDEAIRDSERTYSERRRESIDVTGLGDHAYGESIAVAVLDYDRVANEYRTDRVLSWQYTETVGFTVGRFAVNVSRSAISPTEVLPSDIDISALAALVASRLEQLVP